MKRCYRQTDKRSDLKSLVHGSKNPALVYYFLNLIYSEVWVNESETKRSINVLLSAANAILPEGTMFERNPKEHENAKRNEEKRLVRSGHDKIWSDTRSRNVEQARHQTIRPM